MVRRRPSSKARPQSKKPRSVDRKDSRIRRWNVLDDIELDEEDQFHASRDRILLDEEAVADEDGDEQEVFALHGVSGSDDDDEAEYPYDAADDDDDDDVADADSGDATPSKSKSKSKPKPPPSEKSASDSEEEEETWGHSKGAYYASNAAQLDSEDEEANELEEQEALRLQAKAREGMTDADFGLGDAVEGDIEPPGETEQEVPPNLPSTKVPQDKHTILRTLEKEYPETLALARDWEDTAQNLVETKARVEALIETESDKLELSLQHMYYQALLTYATTLAFYLHLRATDKYATRPDLLRQHPILTRLLTLKEGLHTLEGLGVGQDVAENDDDDGEEEEEEEEEEEDLMDQDGDLWSFIKKRGLEAGELADLLEDAGLPSPPPPSKDPATKKSKSKANAKPSAGIHDTGTRAFDLHEPDYPRAVRNPKQKQIRPVPDVTVAAALDPYGESNALGFHDASDKRARKKSLRFYVSRIESASSRRTNARTKAFGGDDDIPYRERRKERETRLEKERDKRKEQGLLGAGGDDLDDVDPEVNGEERKGKRKRVEEVGEIDIGGAGGYYDLVKQASATKKARKKAEYEAATARPELEPESTSGPRSVTRTILKNKGLTPRRSKAVRNPRVKKRQKYEQAKKKVASQKAVYKGGIGDVSKYSGEQSGISKVVKSVRL